MNKKWTTMGIATLVIGLMLGLAQAAAAFEVSPGAAYQFGDFTYSLTLEGEPVYTFSVPQPAIVWTADAAQGNFMGSAFYGKYRLGAEAEPDSEFYGGWFDEEVASTIGDSEILGADLGYCLSLGSFTVIPTIGYRRAQFWAGYTVPAEGGYQGNALGLEVKGYRAGVQGIFPVGDRLYLKGAIGFGLGTHVRELDVELYNHPDGGEYETDYYYWDVLEQAAKSTDFGVGLAYKLSESLTVEAGYASSSGSVSFADPDATYWSDTYDGYAFGSSAYYIKGTASF